MKTLFTLLILAIALTGIVSCASPASRDAWAEADEYKVAMNEDGQTTPAELAEYMRLVEIATSLSAEDAKSIDWGGLGVQVGASALLAITGVNVMRNRSMAGTQRKA